MATSPTARTLLECKKRGWTAQVVERFNSYTKRRIDLFGVIDLVAIVPPRTEIAGEHEFLHQGAILGIQATSGSNHAARRTKILAEPRARQWIEAGGRLEVWTFAKQGARGKRKVWTIRVEPITAAMFAPRPEQPSLAL